MPTSAMLDFLFKPSPSFVRETLIPLLSSLPAWTRPGPRIGVHLRTFELDKRRYVLRKHQTGASAPVPLPSLFPPAHTRSGVVTLTTWRVPLPLARRFKFARNVSFDREPAYLFASCVACTVVPLVPRFPNASVFLLSDKRASLALKSYLPQGLVSSPLSATGAPPPIHVDKLPGRLLGRVCNACFALQ